MREADLGEVGRDFVCDRLKGGLSLSRAALKRLDLRNGQVFTWTPPTRPPLLLDFDRGDVFGDFDARAAVLSFVRSFFSHVPSGSLWVEEPLPRRSDPFWDDPSVPRERKVAWFRGEEVYSLAFPEDEDARIAQALCSGWDYPGWGGGSFLSRGPVSARCRKQYEVEDSDVISVIDGVRYIICGAYDGMGYVVWRSAASSETSV